MSEVEMMLLELACYADRAAATLALRYKGKEWCLSVEWGGGVEDTNWLDCDPVSAIQAAHAQYCGVREAT